MSQTLQISSFSNPKFKWLKSLAKSKNRKKENLFLMEGRPELDHAISSGTQIELAAFCESYISEANVQELVGDVNLIKLDKALFDDLAYQCVPDNFILVLKDWSHKLTDLDPNKNVVVLEGLEKPGNLGAILRTCDAAGFDQIMVCDSEIDLFNPNVLRNSRGATFGIKCVFTSNEEAFAWLQNNNHSTYAAAIGNNSVEFSKLETARKIAFVFGAESKGLTDFWIENSDQAFMLPMEGIVDSLNLSVAVGIVLYLKSWS
ncbi:MAG: hypothetical protein HN542_09585 [Flavobacteriales bacterium]|nr:hypothetical protein [Flavobacteriales bacterium]NCG29406.1 hypothetical protein [Bacteroidota bacterium]MBT4705526.1 hypothetical protein [Flavobacteriales bacterium]MBT4930813.1 hypothetical protein [Flavobacteriales bacterium]MBT5132146.1 hypothetical protein [Flavobacteriales bacterium]